MKINGWPIYSILVHTILPNVCIVIVSRADGLKKFDLGEHGLKLPEISIFVKQTYYGCSLLFIPNSYMA
jgi:hypothetical protein